MIVPLLVLVLLQAGDIATTYLGLGMGATEGNVLMAPLVTGEYGLIAMILIKAAATFLIALIARRLNRMNHDRLMSLLWYVNGFMTMVVFNNTLVYLFYLKG